MKMIAAALLVAVSAAAGPIDEAADRAAATPPFQRALWFIHVEDEKGTVVFERQSDTLAIPASVRKLASAANASECIGLATRLQTELWREGENLVVRGDGDPSFGSDRYAHYDHAATLTGVGHATIATGALAAGHGIAGNDWYDPGRDREVYCVEDPAAHWIGAAEKAGEGTSPRNLQTLTFGDDTYDWSYSDIGESGTVTCTDNDLAGLSSGGTPRQGTFHRSTARVTWEGVSYQQTE